MTLAPSIAAEVLLERAVLLVVLGVAAFAGGLRLVAHLAGDPDVEWFNWIGYGPATAIPVALALLSSRTEQRDDLRSPPDAATDQVAIRP